MNLRTFGEKIEYMKRFYFVILAVLMSLQASNILAQSHNIHHAGVVSNQDLFRSIIGRFQGKVILVDFWATWCGPCRIANIAMRPLKEELKEKDVVFLYVTGETSPQETWEEMIPDLHGEHFRLTDEQWAYLGRELGIQAIPTYLIIDKQGKITFQQTGFPGITALREELQKVMNE